MNKLIASLLISTQAFAGLPPTTIQGQSDAASKVKTSFQVPFNQATDLGGVKSLIETGNGNILPDAGFEAITSGWTASGGATATANSTAKGTGAKGFDWDSNSAAQTLTSTSVTIPAGLQGKNGIASCNIKTVSGTATHTFTVNNGTTDIVTPITIQSSITAFLGQNEGNKINFVFPTSGTIRIKLAAVNANEPEIYIDNCSINLADNVYDAPLVTQWVQYSATIGATTTPPTKGTIVVDNPRWRRVGDSMEILYQYRQGAAGAAGSGAYLFPLPSGYSIDTSKLAVNTDGFTSGVGTAAVSDRTVTDITGMIVSAYSATQLAVYTSQTGVFGYMGSTTSGLNFGTANYRFTIRATVPIQGWSAVSAVSADQTDYGRTPYTPTFTGFGTVTNVECGHSRVSENMLLDCKFTSGTSTAVEARVSLPNSLSSATTTKIPSIQLAGTGAISTASASSYNILIEPSVSYITFSQQNGSSAGLTKQNGNIILSSGQGMSFKATIPISGWETNGRSPILVGSVTSNSAGADAVCTAYISSVGLATVVRSKGNCLTFSSNNGTGDSTFNFSGSLFTSQPDCQCTAYSAGGQCMIDSTTALSASSVRIQTNSSAGVGTNTDAFLFCMGPR